MPFYSFHTRDGDPYGSFEVWCAPQEGAPQWFWAAGWPGCLHDGEPVGPFVSADDAHDDAQDGEDREEPVGLLAQIFATYVPRGGQ